MGEARIPSPEAQEKLRAEARARQEEEYRRMTPLERMEEAYRLFTYMVES